MDISNDQLRALLAAATPGPWHHCQPFETAPAVRTVHGPVPAQRVDYVSTWPHPGTPKGHRVVIPMEGNQANVRSADMALIARAPDLAAEVIRLRQENDRLSQRVENLREALGDMLDDCEPDRPGAPRLSIREAARAAFKGGDYEA